MLRSKASSLFPSARTLCRATIFPPSPSPTNRISVHPAANLRPLAAKISAFGTSSRRLAAPSTTAMASAAAAAAGGGAASAGAPAADAPKAAIIVIGNEVLSGKVTDANTPWLAKLLYSRGVDLVRAEYIPDDADDIIETVRRLRQRVGDNGYVFTSGGIGPTHDDVTYESVAAAFGVGLERHQPTIAKMEAHYSVRGQELNEARLKMATLPVGCEVLQTPGLWVPLVNLRGVYVLPGIPRLFTAMVDANKERFIGPAHLTQEVYTKVPEGELADVLTALAAAHPSVNIGSYPNTDMADPRFKVRVSMESRDGDALEAAMTGLRSAADVFDSPPDS